MVFTGLAALGTIASVVVALWGFRKTDRKERERESERNAKTIAEWRRSVDSRQQRIEDNQTAHNEFCDRREKEDREWKVKFEENSSQRAKDIYDHMDDRFDQITKRQDERFDKLTDRLDTVVAKNA